ncbi:MAG: hypothetical protein JWL86_4385 [Rhizobium sp.]|nr:hypothetical protein [Rhizobium sp.]
MADTDCLSRREHSTAISTGNDRTRCCVHASGSAPWVGHARLPIPLFWQRGSAGARFRAEVSGCLATAGKTRIRAPFSGFASANSAVCAHPNPGLSDRAGRACVRYNARHAYLALRRYPGEAPSRGRPMQELTSFPHNRHRFRLAHIAMRGSRGKNGMIIRPLESVWFFLSKMLIL